MKASSYTSPRALFEDAVGFAEVGGASAFALRQWHSTLQCSKREALSQVCDDIEAAARAGDWVVLLLDYELGAWLDPALQTPEPTLSAGLPRLQALRFKEALPFRSDELALHLQQYGPAASVESAAQPHFHLKAGIDQKQYFEAIAQIRQHIRVGNCYQVNYTFPFSVQTLLAPSQVYGWLRQRQPVRYGAWIDLGPQQIISCSPELFLQSSVDGDQQRRIVVKPMKGTAARDVDPIRDQANAQTLRHDEKNLAENLMIVDLVRNDLSRIAQRGSVRVEQLFEVEPYPTLWQMTSTISGQLSAVSLYQTLAALYPCGSITGAPKIAAHNIAAQLEQRPRGLYCGAIGFVSPQGTWRLNVAIRTLMLEQQAAGDWQGSYGVGSGIVYDSDPTQEWEECWLKAALFGEATQQAQARAQIETHHA